MSLATSVRPQTSPAPFKAPEPVPVWEPSPWAMMAVLVAAIFAVYGGALRYGLLSFGDLFQITQNPVLSHGFNAEGLRNAFTSIHGNTWTPLTWLSLLLDQALFGSSPVAMRVENVALHACTAVLLFFTLRMATGRLWCSAIVAALFGLHPVSVEGVAWLAERRTVLAGLLSVITVNTYLRYTRTEHAGWYWTSVGCQALAVLSNPITAALPLVLLAVDKWPAQRPHSSAMRLVGEKIPFAVLAMAAGVVSIIAAPEQMRWVTLGALPLTARLNNAAVSYLAYLGNLFWPAHLAALYPHPSYVRPAVAIGAAAILLIVTGVAYANRMSRPYLLAGWLWFIAAVIPALGLVNVAVVGRADRFIYFAQIGIFAAATWFVADLVSPQRRKFAAFGAVGLVLAAISVSAIHVRDWASSLKLLEQAIENTGPNAAAHELAGWERLAADDVEKAAEHFEIAVRIQPELTDIWNEFGQAVLKTGRTKNALQAFWIAVRQEPRNTEYRVSLAKALLAVGEVQGAAEQYIELSRQRPESADYQYEAAKLLLQSERDAEAVPYLERAVRLKPGETSEWHPQADLQAARLRLKGSQPEGARGTE